jgi:hypothetical protein
MVALGACLSDFTVQSIGWFLYLASLLLCDGFFLTGVLIYAAYHYNRDFVDTGSWLAIALSLSCSIPLVLLFFALIRALFATLCLT